MFDGIILDEEEMEKTERFVDISFFQSEFHLLLSSRIVADYEEFYLFNRIKIWQKKLDKRDVEENL